MSQSSWSSIVLENVSNIVVDPCCRIWDLTMRGREGGMRGLDNSAVNFRPCKNCNKLQLTPTLLQTWSAIRGNVAASDVAPWLWRNWLKWKKSKFVYAETQVFKSIFGPLGIAFNRTYTKWCVIFELRILNCNEEIYMAMIL